MSDKLAEHQNTAGIFSPEVRHNSVQVVAILRFPLFGHISWASDHGSAVLFTDVNLILSNTHTH